jgi:hypothetical protein
MINTNDKNYLFDLLKHGKCKCENNFGREDHLCPFRTEINDDHITECNCCQDCTSNCADDI